MRAKHLREVRALLQTPDFLQWHQEYTRIQGLAHEAELDYQSGLERQAEAGLKAEYYSRLGDEALFAAGEAEVASGEASAQAANIENDTFEALSVFELQRGKATEAFESLQRAEKDLEDLRSEGADIRARIEALRESDEEDAATQLEHLDAAWLDLDTRLDSLGREVARAREESASQEREREAMWRSVQDGWVTVTRAQLERSVHAFRSRRLKGKAERWFARAHRARSQWEEVAGNGREEVDGLLNELVQHLGEAESRFGCAALDTFLFWPRASDIRTAVCIPLVDIEGDALNMELRVLEPYLVNRERGVDFVEPVGPDQQDDADPRLDRFFLEGRPGPRESGA